MTFLRILAGKYKNHPLRSPKSSAIRPTSALVRKAVFDICRPRLLDARFLDLFAGSGAMGIEALSQGASSATFVDKSRQAIRCIEDNLTALKLRTHATLLCADVAIAVKKLAREEQLFDIIYIDPPYELAPSLLSELAINAVLEAGGLVFLEQRVGNEPLLSSLQLKESRRFGDSLLLQYWRK